MSLKCKQVGFEWTNMLTFSAANGLSLGRGKQRRVWKNLFGIIVFAMCATCGEKTHLISFSYAFVF